jgi:pectin methylesterase-like acyl-CoA thioesterase
MCGLNIGFSTEQPASVTWYLTSNSQVSAIAGPVLGRDESHSNMEIYNYKALTGGGSGNCQRNRIIGGSWPGDADYVSDRYIQFTVSPRVGFDFVIDSVAMYYGADGGSNMKANIDCSTDSTFTTGVIQLSPRALSSSSGVVQLLIYNPAVQIADSQTFYLRIYPWYTSSATGKYACLQYVTIAGTAIGDVVVELPTVTTAAVSYISTTTALCGGSISNDGGGTITARGVCWNITGDPTIADNYSSDGTGVGLFSSTLTNLTAGAKYYVRAYATNSAGTSYGKQDSLTTLLELVVPTVTTTEPSVVLAKSAKSGGNVTAWGGTDVTAKGVCWNRTGSPTLADSHTVDGSGIGSFNSALIPLMPSTPYFVCAYATNSVGTGYGSVRDFTTQPQAPDVIKIVDLNGTGNYTTVQSAFNDVPDNYTGRYIIFVKKGTYKEKLSLPQNKINVILQGEDRDSTILTYDDYIGKVVGADTIGSGQECASVVIDATDFTAMDITFENTATEAQAVALLANSDCQSYYNCNMLGFQDTYYLWGSHGTQRVYNKNCHVRGSVDFIYGRPIAIFDSCIIHENRNAGTLTAASTEAASKFGLVFLNCEIIADAIGFNGTAITNFYLGRPWQNAPRTVFLNCSEPAQLNAGGWLSWNVTPALYAEYHCTGTGSSYTNRVDWSSQLSDSAAAEYTIENIFSRYSISPAYEASWIPAMPENMPTSVLSDPSDNIQQAFSLSRSYPNPFNPSTKFVVAVPIKTEVQLIVYDLLGKKVRTLLNGEQPAGHQTIEWNGLSDNNTAVTTGIYFVRMISGDFSAVQKVMMVK